MRFDQREWVNDIVTGAIGGAAEAVILAMLVPEPPLPEAGWVGGIVGLVIGMIMQPIRWLLNRRPLPDDSEETK